MGKEMDDEADEAGEAREEEKSMVPFKLLTPNDSFHLPRINGSS